MDDKLKIEYIPISEIVRYNKNPRKNQKAVDVVAKSIKMYGFNNPILLDKENIIIAGHTRLDAAEKLGYTEVPVIWKEDLTPEQVKAYRIMDNKSSEYAEWDLALLKEELVELDEAQFDLLATGFESQELGEIIGGGEIKEDDFIAVDAYARAKNKSHIKEGEIYILGDHRLMCGDATVKEDVDKLMNEQEAILMATDPPYGVNYDPKWRDEADKKGILGNKYPTRSLGDVKNDNIVDWSEAYKLFKGDVMYVYHAGKYASEVAESIKKVGFELINQIIWVKPHFALSRGDYHWKHEPIWYAVRKGQPHNWQGSRKEDTVWQIAGMNAMGSSKDKADEATGHGTQKPIQCMKKPIINNTSKNQGVYDPFGGSGSTLIACEQLNRKCFMMELDPVYCFVIIERWEKLTGEKARKI